MGERTMQIMRLAKEQGILEVSCDYSTKSDSDSQINLTNLNTEPQLERDITKSDQYANALNRTHEWVKNNFYDNNEDSTLILKQNQQMYDPTDRSDKCDNNSDFTIISESIVDIQPELYNSESDFKIEDILLNDSKRNNTPRSSIIPVQDKIILYNKNNDLQPTNDSIHESIPYTISEIKCHINGSRKIISDVNNSSNTTYGYRDDSEISYETVSNGERDKDFNIEDYSEYSSSTDDEITSDQEEKELFEKKTSRNKIKGLEEVETVSINNPIIPLDKKQRKLESTKKETRCKFCNVDIISKNFVRHVETFHRNENEVQQILIMPKKSKERRRAFSLLRYDTNFELYISGIVRPCRKDSTLDSDSFYPCVHCKGLFKKKYLRRHTKYCKIRNPISQNNSRNYISDSHTLTACALDPTNVISRLNVREQVFTIMSGDEIAFEAKKDLLIVHFGESYLKQHKRERNEYACSNRMRELSRLLIAYRQITQDNTIALKQIMVPKNFHNILAAARRISGYDPVKKNFNTPSLALHMGTYLKHVCDELYHLILQESPGFTSKSKEDMQNWLVEVKNVKKLITSRWNIEISSLANKDLQEKRWKKPPLVPLVNDIKIFREETLKTASYCNDIFQNNKHDVETYKLLVNCTLALLILFNRRRIGDVQFLKMKDYSNETNSNFNDFENVLTDYEKILTKKYKRVINSGKGSRAVVILVPEMLQKFIGTLLKFREKYISPENEYVFALPQSKVKWGQGDVAIRNLAKKLNLQHPEAISSNKLRKHIATVTQLLSLSLEEAKQFSKFMGHTEKTHAEFYELPVDIYQTTKVSKLLLMMEKGKLPVEYKGKSLQDIEIDLHFPEENEGNTDKPNMVLNEFLKEASSSNDKRSLEDRIIEEQKDSDIESDTIPCSAQQEMIKRKKVQKKGWSSEETDLLQTTFKEFISKKIYPSSKAIAEFAAKNKMDRSVAIIKAKIQHIITKK